MCVATCLNKLLCHFGAADTRRRQSINRLVSPPAEDTGKCSSSSVVAEALMQPWSSQ